MDRAAAEAILRPDARSALDAWRALVEADAEQVQRVSERVLGGDYYAPITQHFRPGNRPSEELPLLDALCERGDAWADIGAGGGRLAVPLAARVDRVVAVEPSEAMRAALAAAIAEAGAANVEVVTERWPAAAAALGGGGVDVALSAHAIYDVADLASWLEAMERVARRLCVVVLHDRSRGAAWSEIFEAVHGEPIAALPALREFLAVLGALGRGFEVRTAPLAPAAPVSEDEGFEAARRICWLEPGSALDARMQAFLRERYGTGEGMLALPAMRRFTAVVSWQPPS